MIIVVILVVVVAVGGGVAFVLTRSKSDDAGGSLADAAKSQPTAVSPADTATTPSVAPSAKPAAKPEPAPVAPAEASAPVDQPRPKKKVKKIKKPVARPAPSAASDEAGGDKADGDKADGDKADGDKADGDEADGDEADRFSPTSKAQAAPDTDEAPGPAPPVRHAMEPSLDDLRPPAEQVEVADPESERGADADFDAGLILIEDLPPGAFDDEPAGEDGESSLAEVVAELIDAADPDVADVMAKLIEASDPVLVAQLVDDDDLEVAEVVARLVDAADPQVADLVAELADAPDRRQVAEVLKLVDSSFDRVEGSGGLDPEIAKKLEDLDIEKDLELTSRPGEMGQFAGLNNDDQMRVIIRVLVGLVAREDLPRSPEMPREPKSSAESRRWPLSRARWPLPPPGDQADVVKRDPLPARRDSSKAS